MNTQEVYEIRSRGYLCGYIRNFEIKGDKIRGSCGIDDKPCINVFPMKFSECEVYKTIQFLERRSA